VLLFPLLTSPSQTTQSTIIANYAYAQVSSNDNEDSYPSTVISLDPNSVGTIKKKAMQIVNKDNSTSKTTGL
jgi:hypothetical protein